MLTFDGSRRCASPVSDHKFTSSQHKLVGQSLTDHYTQLLVQKWSVSQNKKLTLYTVLLLVVAAAVVVAAKLSQMGS